jgi:hypothetical protein
MPLQDTVNSSYLVSHDTALVAAYVESIRPGLRGWNYRHIYALCNSDVLTIEALKGAVTLAPFRPDSKRLVTARYDKMAKIWDEN